MISDFVIRSTVVEGVRALAIGAALLLDGQIFFPYLLALNLFIIHAGHLALQRPATVLNVEDLAALEPLLVAMDDVDYEEADRHPDDQDQNYEDIHADIIEDWEAVLFVDFLVI